MLHYLGMRLVYNHSAITHAYNAADTHAQGSEVEAKNLLSRQANRTIE